MSDSVSAIHGVELAGTALSFVVGVGIVLGNLFVLAAVKLRPTLQTPLNIYVASICVSGVLTGLLAPVQVGFYVGPVHFQPRGMYDCEVRKWLTVTFWAASTNAILCMLAIAVERYRILFRRVSPRKSEVVVAAIAVVSILYDALMFGTLPQSFVIVHVEDPHEVWIPNGLKTLDGRWLLVHEDKPHGHEMANSTAASLHSITMKPEDELWTYPYAKHCHFDTCVVKWIYLVNFLLAFLIPFAAILVLYHLLSVALVESSIAPDEKRSKFAKGVTSVTSTLFRTQGTLSTYFGVHGPMAETRLDADGKPRTYSVTSDSGVSGLDSAGVNSLPLPNDLPRLSTVGTLRRVRRRKTERLRAVRGMRMVVVAFFACWLPAHCMLLHVGFGHDWHDLEQDEDAREHLLGHLNWTHKLLHDLGIQVIIAHNWIHLLVYPAYNKVFKAELKSLWLLLLDVVLCRHRGQASISGVSCDRQPDNSNDKRRGNNRDGEVQLRRTKKRGGGGVISSVVGSSGGVQGKISKFTKNINQLQQQQQQQHNSSEDSRNSGGFGRFSLVLPATAYHFHNEDETRTPRLKRAKNKTDVVERSTMPPVCDQATLETVSSQEKMKTETTTRTTTTTTTTNTGKKNKRRWSTGEKVHRRTKFENRTISDPVTRLNNDDSGVGKSERVTDEVLTEIDLNKMAVDTRDEQAVIITSAACGAFHSTNPPESSSSSSSKSTDDSISGDIIQTSSAE